MNPIEIIEILVIAILIPIAIFLWLAFILAVVSIIQEFRGVPKIQININKIEKGDEKDD